MNRLLKPLALALHTLGKRINQLLWPAIIIAIILVMNAKHLLVAEVPMEKADVIIVLGGESGQRVIGAAELYHQGVAPAVFVTGNGDCLLIRKRLIMAGVPEQKIGHECAAVNTQQNSEKTKERLQHQHIQRAVLVTSWFHTRRALAVFRKTWPEVEFGTHAVTPGYDIQTTPLRYEAGYVLAEYLKMVWYAVYHGL